MKITVFSILAFTFASIFQDMPQDILLGKWSYLKGSYEYYDGANRKLKESSMNAISNLDIEVTKDHAIISYPNKKTYTSNYAFSTEGNKSYVSISLSNNPVTYEIASLTKTALVLTTKNNINFYVDGDTNKKVAYCILKIYLEKKT